MFKHPESAPALPSNFAGASLRRVERVANLTPRKEESSLPSPELDQATHDEVLRLFFDYFNPQCMWVHEKEFRTDLRTAPIVDGTVIRPRQSAYYSPMLHNIVLAIGVSLLQIDPQVRERLRTAFSRRAKDLFEDEVESAMLSTVSGVLLLGTYHAIVARQNLGFVYAGVGFRLVQACELPVQEALANRQWDLERAARTGSTMAQYRTRRDNTATRCSTPLTSSTSKRPLSILADS